MAQIQIKDVAHNYTGPSADYSDYALKPLNLTWDHGKTYALLGPSGCGKTTLLNILSGLISPTEGQIFFDGTDVTQLPTTARNIAQVFQFPVNYDTMSVRDNLAFPLTNKGVDRRDAHHRAEEIAEALEIQSILSEKAVGLTADLKQLVSLGRGLVREDVSAILFDEPLTVIDPAKKWRLRAKIKEIQRSFDHTMIYVTHDQTEALTFADHVIVMEHGIIRQIGTPKELFEKPAHTFVGYFIGSPGMNILPVEVKDGIIVIGGETIDLTLPQVASIKGLELGIRPEFIQLNENGKGLPVSIRSLENIGKHRIARGDISGHALNIILPASVNIPADTMFAEFDPDKARLYQGGKLLEEQS